MKRIIVLLTICMALVFGITTTADAQHRGRGHGHYKHHKQHRGHYNDRDRYYGHRSGPRYRSHDRVYYNSRPAYNRTTVVVPAPPRPRVVVPPHPRRIPVPPHPRNIPLPPHPGLPR